MFAMMLCDDLMFTSRVLATGRALDLPIQIVRTQTDLANWLRSQNPACILVDLHNSGFDVNALAQQLPASKPFLVGFGSHVDTSALQAARDAGFDLVLPRSKFVELLEPGLPQWCAARPSSIQ
jgi:hypothetical protein